MTYVYSDDGQSNMHLVGFIISPCTVLIINDFEEFYGLVFSMPDTRFYTDSLHMRDRVVIEQS